MDYPQFIYGSFPDQERPELHVAAASSGISADIIGQIKKIFSFVGDKALDKADEELFVFHLNEVVLIGLLDYSIFDKSGRSSRRARGIIIQKPIKTLNLTPEILRKSLTLTEVDVLRVNKVLPLLTIEDAIDIKVKLSNIPLDTKSKYLSLLAGNRIETSLVKDAYIHTLYDDIILLAFQDLKQPINITTYTNLNENNHTFALFGSSMVKELRIIGQNVVVKEHKSALEAILKITIPAAPIPKPKAYVSQDSNTIETQDDYGSRTHNDNIATNPQAESKVVSENPSYKDKLYIAGTVFMVLVLAVAGFQYWKHQKPKTTSPSLVNGDSTTNEAKAEAAKKKVAKKVKQPDIDFIVTQKEQKITLSFKENKGKVEYITMNDSSIFQKYLDATAHGKKPKITGDYKAEQYILDFETDTLYIVGFANKKIINSVSKKDNH